MSTLSLVIPALNEGKGIGEIIRRVLAVRARLTEAGIQEMELIVVDDGSRDRTAEVVSGFDGVRLIQHPANRGYGAALKTGVSQARGEWLAFLDADGTYPPERLPEMCQAAMEAQADVVIGSRMSG